MLPRLALRTFLPALLVAAPVFADPPDAVYVSTGAAGQILSVAGSSLAVVHTAPSAIGDLTVGPDLLLYASLPAANMIIRLDPAVPPVRGVNGSVDVVYAAGTATDPTGPAELRFGAGGDLYFNATGGGVWRLRASALATTYPASVPPVLIANTSGGSALAFTHAGDLVAGSGLSLVGIPVASAAYSFAAAAGAATGAAVAAGGEGTRLPFATGDVVAGVGSQLRLFGKNGAQKTVLATFASTQRVRHVEIDADDSVYVTTLVSETPTTAVNGRVWKILKAGATCGTSSTGDCVLLASTPKQQGKYAPMVGLALAPSTRRLAPRQLTATMESRTHRFDFGSNFVEITGSVSSSCQISVASVPLGRRDVAGLLATAPGTYAANPYLGDQGFARTYDITSACDFAGSAIDVFIAALTSVNTNPRILRCPAAGATGCGEVPLFGFYATGPIDGDGAIRSRTTDNFSRWFIASKGLTSAGTQPEFCGLESPFKGDATTFTSGSNVTVKFRLAAPGGTCASGPYLSTALPLIAVARLSPSFFAVPLASASGNSNDPPTFRYDERAQQYIFNLDTAVYEAGVYELTITDLNSWFASPQPITFQVTVTGGNKK